MTTITIMGTVGAVPVQKNIGGKDYYQFSIAHRNGKEDTTWCRVIIPNYGQDISKIDQGIKMLVIGRPIFGCYEGRAQVTIWADIYEV